MNHYDATRDPPTGRLLGRVVGQVSGPLFNGDGQGCLAYADPRAYQNYIKRIRDYGCISTTTIIKHFDDIMVVIEALKTGSTRDGIVQHLRRQGYSGPTDETLIKSINVAARYMFMVRVGTITKLETPGLDWSAGSISGFLSQRSPFMARNTRKYRNIRFPRVLSAWSLDAMTGIKTRFVDYLDDHLRLRDTSDGVELLVFHHVGFLEHHRYHSFFPAGFVEETLRTLSLLFPQAEFSHPPAATYNLGRWFKFRQTKRQWLEGLCKDLQRSDPSFCIDQRLVSCRNPQFQDRNLSKFRYWGDRLTVLVRTFEEARPTSVSQWWHDNRNGVQWYNFWVIILVFAVATFLSLVQCVLGAIQVYKSL